MGAGSAPRTPKWKICIDPQTGDLVHTVRGNWAHPGTEAKLGAQYRLLPHDHEFIATLKLTSGYSYYNGTTTVWWTDILTHAKYPQTFDEFWRTIQDSTLHDGSMMGKWGFTKSGQRQSIYLIEQIL